MCGDDKRFLTNKNAKNEVGCIHTTQGYDLNYAGIIFGKEISYDKFNNCIVIKSKNYFDKNGKQAIRDPAKLKQYIINIYQTIMLRGIKGTFVYVCDDALREYFARYIPLFKTATSAITIMPETDVIPFENAIPLYDIQVAAGSFSELQNSECCNWINLPVDIKPSKNLFACKIVGESMNKIIPNGSTCLFRKEVGGSRNGKIVLVQLNEIIDQDSGTRFTIKEYESKKIEDKNGWKHVEIILRPHSYDAAFQEIVITEDSGHFYQVVGEFIKVIE